MQQEERPEGIYKMADCWIKGAAWKVLRWKSYSPDLLYKKSQIEQILSGSEGDPSLSSTLLLKLKIPRKRETANV